MFHVGSCFALKITYDERMPADIGVIKNTDFFQV